MGGGFCDSYRVALKNIALSMVEHLVLAVSVVYGGG